jgi:hypothetical protein
MFSHERLKVYDKALVSVANLARCSALWDKRHSVVDHLLRASESIVLNLAEGARLWGAGHKQHSLDYAIFDKVYDNVRDKGADRSARNVQTPGPAALAQPGSAGILPACPLSV